MAAPILVTKLFVPPTRVELVHRSGLIERLTDGLDRKLTLLSAPAGFGKTTLVSHWVENLRDNQETDGQPIKVAWLSLDGDDNDPVRFLTYFITALKQIKEFNADLGQGALSMLQSPQPPSANTVLISLINDLATLPDKIICVLDDCHLIEAQSIHQAIIYLLDNLPPQLHLVIATREDPYLSLGRLRARNQVTELRAADLRFTASEAADFLNRVMGLNLSPEDIAELETRTEGWIAGLQLAAISMQGRKDRSGFIKSFTGGHRMVLDFLIEEVLGQQPESVQNFLLQTAILDRLTGPLCDVLTGQDNGQETLEMLDHANLFIVPLDDDRLWYRYHHLFAGLLRQRLRQTQPEQLLDLHCKASEWYKQNGLSNQAIDHALEGKEYEQATNLIRDQIDDMWRHGEHGKLRRWLRALPDEILISESLFGIIRAYYLHTIGEYALGEQYLQKIELVLESDTNHDKTGSLPEHRQVSDIERSELQGKISTIRALIYSFDGNVDEIIQHANRALNYLPEQDLIWRNLAAFALGDAYSYFGNMVESYGARFEALRACEVANNVYYTIIAALKLASTLREQGELYRTRGLCRDYIKLAEEKGLSETSFTGCLKAILGEVLAELDDLDGAIQHAEKGVKIAERGQNLVTLAMSYLYLMRVLFTKMDIASAEEVIEKVSRLERESTIPTWLSSQMASWQVKFWLAQEDHETASIWAEERDLFVNDDQTLVGIDYFTLIDLIVFARLLVTQGRLDEFNRLMKQLYHSAEAGGRLGRLIEIRILQAYAFQSTGDIDRALKTLKRALALAEPKGFIRIFVDEGPPMARLLYEALNRGIEPEYVQRLLAAFPVTEPEKTFPTKPQVDPSELIEPLSEREIEVLQLLAKGLTNQVIATRLVLSPHTVKTHARNIYSKLAVSNRIQAVDKARTLGILPPD